jgi:HD-like signal output (HDOD) protein
MLSEPLKDLTAWTRYFARADIPVLRRTVVELDAMRERADTLNAQEVAEVVMRDPLMTLKVLAHMSTHKGRRQLTDIETVEATIVMLGAPPFFRIFSNMTVVEDTLREQPEAHLGLMRVITRAYRAACFARDWASYRQDLDAEQIIIAALLHDLAEMLLWCFAPALALKIKAMQKTLTGLRSTAAQRDVLHVELNDLEIALMKHWRLPELLLEMLDDKHANNSRVRNVVYAINLARHCANGWNDPALPDDYRNIADLLHATPQHVREMLEPQTTRLLPP